VIRIGPAGWSYRDWEGVVYPMLKPKGFHEATYLAQYFDTIEINTTFYRPPERWIASNWVRRVGANPRFRFTAKLFRGFTHERNATADDERQFKEGIAPLAEAGRLGALLLQFPWSCRNDEGNRAYLFDLFRRFRDFPLVLEMRHASWNQPAVRDVLAELGIGMCNIDQPLFARSITPSAHVTSPVGYIRLHGRNYQNWFTENQQTGDRYNYLYTLDELEPWVERTKVIAKRAEDTYVVTNNHFLGKAIVNAFELVSLLFGQPVEPPKELRQHYPVLDQVSAEKPTQAPPR
jgi:uncharacterized protein YecE (DUF72 family)